MHPDHIQTDVPADRNKSLLRSSKADKYSQVRDICLYDYRTMGVPGFAPSSILNPLASQYVAVLEYLSTVGDLDTLKIERALRYLCEACEEGALSYLDPIINRKFAANVEWRSINDYPHTTNEAISIQAHSIAAYAYFRKYMASAQECRQIVADSFNRFQRREYQTRADDRRENIMNAARHATHAAAGGFVSPAVLMAGFAFKTLAAQISLDMRDMKHYRPLWRALEGWTRAVSSARTLRRPSQVSYQENEGCQASGCNASRGSGPRSWSCHCDIGAKPWYCSKECQDHDWARHQAACSTSGVIAPPPAVEEHYGLVHDVLLGMMQSTEPVERVEAVEEDEDKHDPMNGTVLGVFELPCPFGTPGKWVQYAMKRYA